MKRAIKCRCCGSKDLFLYLDLGKQPLANSYHKKEEKLKKFPLEVILCLNCFHSQLSIIVNPETMFKNYLYVSGTTQTFRDHTKNLAIDAVKRFSKKKLSVLDIACNDGTQLEHFRNLGCDVRGVDPAENLRKITKEKKIPVEVAYWNEKVANKMNEKFDIITGTNVFAHVNNLDEFLNAVKMVLSPDGILILEFPYANEMIEKNEFDTVYHEHLSYFLVNSFKTLVNRLGFYIRDVLQTKIHGGSIRFFVKVGENDNSKKVAGFIAKEKQRGLLSKKTYIDFSKRVKKNKANMLKLLKKLKKNNMKIIGYGASAKGNTMLNYFKINLDYIVDDNDLKWNFYTPGQNIIIKDPKELKKEKMNLAIVILSWNFYNEIINKVKRFRNKKFDDIAITYVPVITEHEIKKAKFFSISA